MRYQNPILRGDYSDPDVVRVGDDYYMISSSFTYFPGIPILHSRDLVHWALVNYVARSLPFKHYDTPRHKRGTWAPSIRYHEGTFFVYVCAPDEGLFAFTATDPLGEWVCRHVKDVTGWIDPCPLWDEDGNAYLLHAFAGSRVGIKSILYLHRMSWDGLTILDEGKMVFDGGSEHVTTEGPKFYKHEGEYLILAPAGGVATGWQLAMRADNPYGPYTVKKVLEQKGTEINGPHQGGLIDTKSGRWWFIHFQDVGVYGRIPHLQPVTWQEGWPIMGRDGAPVLSWEAPDTGFATVPAIPTSDAFAGPTLGLQWQWQANPNPGWYQMLSPALRLNCAHAPNLFHAGQFLSQLMQAYDFTWTVRLSTCFEAPGDCAGIAIMGYGYAYVAVFNDAIRLVHGVATDHGLRYPETVTETCVLSLPRSAGAVTLKMQVRQGMASFFANDEALFSPFALTCGGWTGARPGIFAANFEAESHGYAVIESVIITDDQVNPKEAHV